MKFQVRSITMDRHSREFRKERTEYVDTEENPLFKGVNAPGIRGTRMAERMVEAIYEAYENSPDCAEDVKVVGIKRQEQYQPLAPYSES